MEIMKVSREQVAEQRAHILEVAGKLFRQRGFDDVTVAEVMKEAGLTHGAFCGYFPSKDALISWNAVPGKSIAAFADGYLSLKHRDERDTSCCFSSLGTEAARGSAELRHRMTESVRRLIDRMSQEAEGDKPREKRRAAIAA